MTFFELGSFLGSIIFTPLFAFFIFYVIWLLLDWCLQYLLKENQSHLAAVFIASFMNFCFGLGIWGNQINEAREIGSQFLWMSAWVTLFSYWVMIPIGIYVVNRVRQKSLKANLARVQDYQEQKMRQSESDANNG